MSIVLFTKDEFILKEAWLIGDLMNVLLGFNVYAISNFQISSNVCSNSSDLVFKVERYW